MRTVVPQLKRGVALAAVCVLLALLSACGAQRAGLTPPVTDPQDWIQQETAASDEVPPLPPDWPIAPPGASSPADWEAIYQDALNAASGGELMIAQDLLFVLQELTFGHEPAEADTLYVQHRRSLHRRIVLLGGLIAEQTAFGGSAAAADSILTIAYLGLDAFAFPDSLVPASGTRLPRLQADLLKVQHAKVDRWVDYFTGSGRRHFVVWLERKAEVSELIKGILIEEGLPTELISLAMIESGLSTRATSRVGAGGPWQFMPGTARRYGLRVDWWEDQRRDWELSTRAACRYLKDLYAEFNDWALVLASYNAGEGRVRRQLRLNGHDNYWDFRLPRETVEYVPKFIAAAGIVADPEAHGFTVHPPTPLAWDEIVVADATDLNLIAACAGVSEAEIARLNPSLVRGATPPGVGPRPVRVPVGTGRQTDLALAKVPADRRLTWRKHTVQRGETLSHIASRWGTTAAAVQEANGMGRSTLIRPGDQLLLPMPRELANAARQRAEQAGRYVPPAGHEQITYKVRSGDTLGAIAKRLGVTVAHLQRVNGIKDPSRLRIGQKLSAYRPGGRDS